MLSVVILAAGKGTRMRSDLPKVLHPLGGMPLLSHVLATARQLDPDVICVVYGHGGELVPQRLAAPDVTWILQEPQLGTGHAVMQALPRLHAASPAPTFASPAPEHLVLALYGDVPLIRAATLQRLIAAAGADKLGLITAHLDEPHGYGRIVRENGKVARIVEEKDASEDERAIREVNTGILVAPFARLIRWLPQLSNCNA